MTRFHTARIVWIAAAAVAAALPAAAAVATSAAAATTYTITNLGSLGDGSGDGLAVNNNGQVTGYSYTSQQIPVDCPPRQYGQPKHCYTHPSHAFLYSNGTMTDLGSFTPAAINDNGVMVGGPYIDSGGTVQNLNTLIPAGSPTIQNATAINNNGQIVASATGSSGGAVLLNPS